MLIHINGRTYFEHRRHTTAAKLSGNSKYALFAEWLGKCWFADLSNAPIDRNCAKLKFQRYDWATTAPVLHNTRQFNIYVSGVVNRHHTDGVIHIEDNGETHGVVVQL